MGVGVEAGVNLNLGVLLGGKLDKANNTLNELKAMGVEERTLNLQGNINAPVGNVSQLVTSIPGPEAGLELHLRRVTIAPVFGVTLATAGTLLIVAKGLMPAGGAAIDVTGDFVAIQAIEITRTATIPNSIFFSRAQAVVNYPENIIIAWTGGVGALMVDIDAVQCRYGDNNAAEV